MNFNHIDTRLSVRDAKQAQKKFQWLTLELGLREDNWYVGTGLGGNNFQLLTLMGLKHTLVKRPIDIRVDDNRIAWSGDWLANTPKKQIRAKLDEVFPTIQEKFKLLSVALSDVDRCKSMLSTVKKYPQQFPKIVPVLQGKGYCFDKSLSYIEQYILACVMCQELAARLDKGDASLVQPMGEALADFPLEHVLLSVRKYITIERLVKHDLDEDRIFGKVINRVNKAVDN